MSFFAPSFRQQALALLLTSCGFAATPEFEVALVRLPEYHVTDSSRLADPVRAPQMCDCVTCECAAEKINIMDTEDALKYAPSLFLRKRNYGDTQATLGTRVWGVSSSARSVVYADGVPLSALVANNNNIGAPRWGMVAPSEIARIDVMQGPFAAAYPGNSMGAVVEITTRMPEHREISVSGTQAWQDFSLYGTHGGYSTSQANFAIGDRVKKLSFWLSGNYQDSESQPLSFVTASAFPTGTIGGYAAANKFGQSANVVGAGGLLHTKMGNAKLKVAYDLSPTFRATYTVGWWTNDATSVVETYLRDPSSAPTFAGLSGFAGGRYELAQRHVMHSLDLRAALSKNWDLEASASLYRMVRDEQRFPTGVAPSGTEFSTAGRVASLNGTGWNTVDLKATWRPEELEKTHEVTFGLHDDRYVLANPTYTVVDWRGGATPTGVATEGDGKTRTEALWAQDVWQFNDALQLIVGARYEEWRAYGGLNVNGSTTVRQPQQKRSATSPKMTLTWNVSKTWLLALSVGQAYRFATPAELYQLVSTGTTFTAPNADLKPDDALATELRIERVLPRGRARLSVFQDDVHDAIISQYRPLVSNSTTLFQYLSNVDHVRARGVELALDGVCFFRSALELGGSVTYLDARTLATQGRGQFGEATGKRLPNIPDWRASFNVTWRPSSRWSATVGGRYSGMMFTTLDQTDVNPNTYQGFSAWFVADAKVSCKINEQWNASLGCDNLLNRKYFLFHPFPQRTVVADVRFAF